MSGDDCHRNLPKTYVPGFHDEEAIKKMEYRKFGDTDMLVSVLSMGCSGIGPGTYRDPDKQEAIQTIQEAVKKGINFLDVAPWYGFGSCEPILGEALTSIPRKAYYVATKVGRYKPDYHEMFDFSAKKTIESVNQSLEYLGVDYIDLIQVHDVEFIEDYSIILNETLPTLKMLKESGKVRYIGITGLPPKFLRKLYGECSFHIDSVLSHCHCLLFNTEFNDYVDDYESKGTGTINAALLGMGLLSNTGPMHWHLAQQEIKDACINASNYCEENGVNLAKIATYFSLKTFKGCTNLIGFAETHLLHKNLETLYNGLTEKENQVLLDVLEKFMKNLSCNDWSELEITRYRKKYNATKS